MKKPVYLLLAAFIAETSFAQEADAPPLNWKRSGDLM